MEIRMPCTHCGKVLLIKDASTIRVGICPNCHRKVTIPASATHNTPSKPSDTPLASMKRGSKSAPKVIPRPPGGGKATDSSETKSNSRSDSVAGKSDSSRRLAGSRDAAKKSSTPPQTQAAPPGLDPLTESPDAVWFVRSPGGGQYGPASNQVLQEWISQGRVGTQSLVWRDGWADWLPAERVFQSLVDSAPRSPQQPTRDGSKAAEYLEKKRQTRPTVPSLWILLGLVVIALITTIVIVVW